MRDARAAKGGAKGRREATEFMEMFVRVEILFIIALFLNGRGGFQDYSAWKKVKSAGQNAIFI